MKSRYHVKGLVYMRTHEFFAEKVPGGSAALLPLLTRELRDFFSQTFLASGWYDALPIASLVRAEAKAMGHSVADYLEARAGWQAEKDIHTVYRMLLRLASPGLVAGRLAKMMGQVLDFGKTEILERRTDGMKAVVRGMPEALGEWYSGGLTVYAMRALAIAGAKQPSCRMVGAHLVAADPDGVPLADLSYDLSW
jgi:hypothetical protein